jgi:predicted acyltransferase (DUF342 family)
MSYAYATSGITAKNGLLNQSLSDTMEIDVRTRGNGSTFVGYSTPYSLYGQSNTVIGFESALFATSGNNLVLIGVHAGMSNRASENIFIGNRAGQNNQIGTNLIYLGSDAGRYTDSLVGSYNCMSLGHKSGYNNTGYENVFIGFQNNYSPTYTWHNTSIGNYSYTYGSNTVNVGWSNFSRGHRNITMGTTITDNSSNNVLIGHNIHNYGKNCVIIKSDHEGIYENRQNNFINIQNVIVASNNSAGKYVLKFQSDLIALETPGGNTVTLGGENNIVQANYYAINASNFDVNAPTNFTKNTTFNNTVVMNSNLYSNGISVFNGPVLFTNPQLTITSKLDLLSNVDIKGQLQVFDVSYFKDQVNVSGVMNVTGYANFDNDIIANNDVIVKDNLYVLNGRGTFCNELVVKSRALIDGLLSVYNDAVFAKNVEIDGNLALYGNQTLNSNLEVIGRADIGSNLHVYGKTTLESNLHVNDDAFFQKNVNIDSNLIVDGDMRVLGTGMFTDIKILNSTFSISNSLNVYGNTQFNNSLTANATSTFQDNTYFNDVSTFNSNAVFNETVNFNSNIVCTKYAQLSNAIISGTTELNDVTINGTFKLKNPWVMSNDVYIYGRTFQYGEMYLYNKTTSFNDFDVKSNLISSGDFIANGTSLFNKTAIFNSNATFCNEIYSKGYLNQTGIASFSNTIYSYGILEQKGHTVLSNTVDVYGNTTFYGSVNVPIIQASNLDLQTLKVTDNTILDGSTLVDGVVINKAYTTFCNDTSFLAPVTFSNVVDMTSNVTMNNLEIRDDLTVNGVLNFKEIVTIWGDTTIFGDIYANSNLFVDGSTFMKGKTTFCNDAHFLQPVGFYEITDFNNTVNFNSNINISHASISNAVFNDSIVNSNLIVRGVLSASGDTIFNGGIVTFSNNTRFLDTNTIFGRTDFFNEVSFNCNVNLSHISSSNATFDNITVNSNLEVRGYSIFKGDKTTFSNIVDFASPLRVYEVSDYYNTVNYHSNINIAYGSISNASINDCTINDLTVNSNIEVIGNFIGKGDTLFKDGIVTFSNNTFFTETSTVYGRTDYFNDVSFNSNAYFTNILSSNASLNYLNIQDNLTVKGFSVFKGNHTTFCNELTLADNVSVLGVTDFNNIANFHSNINVANATFSNGVFQNIIINSNLGIRGDLFASGNTVFRGGVVTFSNNTHFMETNTLYGRTYFNNAVVFNCNVDLSIVSSSNAKFDNVTINSNLEVLGYTTYKGDTLFKDGQSTFSNAISIAGPASVYSHMIFNNDASFNCNISTKSINGLTAEFDNVIVNSNLEVHGVTTYNGNTLYNTDTLFLNGITTFSNTLLISGPTSVYSRIVFNNDASFNCNIATKSITTPSAEIDYATINSNLEVLGNTTYKGDTLFKYGQTTFSNALSIAGPASVYSHMIFNNDASFNCNISTKSINGVNAEFDHATINSNLEVLGNTTYKGDTLFEDGQTTFSNALSIAGPASVYSHMVFNNDASFNCNISTKSITTSSAEIDYATINSNLEVKGDIISTGNTIFKGTVTYCNDVISTKSFTQDGNTTFNNTTFFNSNVYVNAEATFEENISVSGTASILNATIQNSLNVNSNIDIGCNLHVNGHIVGEKNCVISGITTLCNDLLELGNSTFVGTVNFSNATNFIGSSTFNNRITANDIVVNSNVSIYGDMFLTNDLIVNGTVTYCNFVIMQGSSLELGDTVFVGSTTFCNQPTFVQSAYFNSNVVMQSLEVSENAQFDSDVNIYGKTNVHSDLIVDSNLNVLKDTQIDRSLTVTGAVTLSNNLLELGNSVFVGRVNFSNTVDFVDVSTFTSGLITNSLEVIENASLHSSLWVGSNVDVEGDVDICGNMKVTENLLVNGTSTFSNQINVGNTSIFYGEAQFLNRTYFYNDSTFTCNVSLTNALIVSGNTTFYNNLDVWDKTYIHSDLYVDSNLHVNRDLIVNGHEIVNGSATLCNDLVVLGSSLFNNDAAFSSNITISGVGTFNNIASFSSNVSLNTATVSSNLTITGTLNIDGSNLVVSGCNFANYINSIANLSSFTASNTTFTGNVLIDSNLIASSLIVQNSSTFSNYVKFVNQSNIYVGNCNLAYYLEKINNLSSGSNSFNADNISATSITANTISSQSLTTTSLTSQSGIFQTLSVTGTANFGLSNIFLGGCNLAYLLAKVQTMNNFDGASNSFIGNVSLNSNLYVNGEILCRTDISTSNNILVGVDAHINNDLYVNGISYLNDLSVNGQSTFNNPVAFQSDVLIGSDSLVIGTCNMSYYINALKNLINNTNTDLSNSNVCALSNQIYSSINSTIEDSVMIGSNLVVGGNLIVSGGTCFQNVTFASVTSSEFSTAGPVVMEDNATIYKNLAVYGNSTLCNSLSVYGPVTMTNVLYANSNVLVKGVASFSNSVNIYGPLNMYNNFTIGSNLNMLANATVKNSFTVGGISTFCNNVLMHSNLDVKKVTTLNDVIINGNTTLSNVSKSFTVLGTTSLSNLNTLGKAEFKNEIVSHDKIRLARSNCDWLLFTQSNLYNLNYSDLVFQSANNTKVTFTDDFDPGTFNFTGSHRCSFTQDLYNSNDHKDDLIGKIVVSIGKYNNLNNKANIEIDEAVPIVELANKTSDKRVFGVIAGFEEKETNSRFFKLGNIRFNREKEQNDTKIIVNAVGEGGIWICNENGKFNNGDLITTSEIIGYGIKQNNDIVTSYTVAKITCDCEFDLNSKIYKCEKFTYNGKDLLRAFVGCIYKC